MVLDNVARIGLLDLDLRVPQVVERNVRIDVMGRVVHHVVEQGVDVIGEPCMRCATYLSDVVSPFSQTVEPGD